MSEPEGPVPWEVIQEADAAAIVMSSTGTVCEDCGEREWRCEC